MKELELLYVAGEHDFYIWERLEELFNTANFEDLESLIELEPIVIRSIKGLKPSDIFADSEIIEANYNDLVKYITEEELYLIYFSNLS